MKRSIIYLFVILIALSPIFNVFAQGNQEATVKTIKPKVFALDFVFSYNMLNSIELRASEVDALLEVKNALKPYIEQIQKENIPLTNAVTFEISTAIAHNMLQFMERGKLVGSDAEKYKRFVEGIAEAAKALKPEEKK